MLKKLTATGVLAFAVTGAALAAAAPANATTGPNNTSSSPTLNLPITALNCDAVPVVDALVGATANCGQ